MSNPETQQPVVSGATQFLRLVDAVGAAGVDKARRGRKWTEDNQEGIRRFAAWVEVFKVWGIDDITAEDGSELREVLFDPKILRTLLRHGWYPPANMSGVQLAFLAGGLDDPDEEIAELAHQEFINKFRDDTDAIEQHLAAQFPDRAQIINDAFDAHRQAKYNLSIPVFLIQADGIAWERLGKTLFSSKTIQQSEGLASKVDEGILRKLFVGLMWPEWPLTLSVSQRTGDFSGLNRHQVLHGEVADYGTEVNSLQAMALLNFCSFILKTPSVSTAPGWSNWEGGMEAVR